MEHSLSSLEDRIGALEIEGRAIMFGDGALEATMGLWPATTNPYGSGCRGLSEQDGALEASAGGPQPRTNFIQRCVGDDALEAVALNPRTAANYGCPITTVLRCIGGES